MAKEYILSLDQSTSASKAMIVDKYGNLIENDSMEHKTYYPNPGWVEHDPLEIYDNVKKVLRNVVNKTGLKPEDISVLAITNQRETVVVWDKETGLPVYNAIVWQCRRTSDICAKLKSKGLEKEVRNRTGLLLDPYFSATKVKWILENISGTKEKASQGKLLMGTIDSWLIWKFTKGMVHATDYTNASRTLLFNIKTLKWDSELLRIFNIPDTMLPEIKSSNSIFGETAQGELFENSIPLSGVIGDSQGALFGQNCFETGMVKATYGTGSSILMNIGEKFTEVRDGLVTSIAWGIDDKVEYAVEGIIHCTGDSLKWVKDNLGLFESFDEVNNMLNSSVDNEGVYLIPAFVGLGIPYWDSNARAAIVGMSRGTRKEHIVRAAVESIAYQIKDAIDVMESATKIRTKKLSVDGGPTKNLFLMQFQADLLQLDVVSTEITDASSIGSAYLAGIGIGLWNGKSDISRLKKKVNVFSPTMDLKLRDKYYEGWKSSVRRVLTK
jgi:glycerol kinase